MQGITGSNEMSESAHSSSAKAILYAFLANFGIAIAKSFAAVYAASGSMLAEAIHSYADCGNQILLYIGLKQSEKPADKEHPLGYGKLTYFWSFIVAILLFSMGGLFSIYEGWHKIHSTEALSQVWIALTVLAVSVVLETFSLLGALKEIRSVRDNKPF
jgi:cation diffusion facilitator family transporter